jgi:hypothetical protein
MRCLTLFLALMVSMPPAVVSSADGPDFWRVHGVSEGDVLKIRREADPASDKVGEIPPHGTCIRAIRCVGGLTYEEFATLSEAEKTKIEKARPRWCRVEYDGVTGWVNGRYLREGGCPAP